MEAENTNDNNNNKKRGSPEPTYDPALEHNKFENSLVTRYASAEMSFLWSAQKKFSTWRRLWIYLARGEKALGLNITDEQISEMEAHINDVDFKRADQLEKELRHDVMSHIHAWAEQCPKAKPIIHLGATSCFVGDNTDLIQIKESLGLVCLRLLRVMRLLKDVALKYKALPTLGFTHFQAAQLTTVGKRACLWLQDFMLDYLQLEQLISDLPFRGVKGTTGTQASFLELFNGDHEKVKQLDNYVRGLAGFNKTIGVSGQTYTRKIDFSVLQALSAIAQSSHKFATDMRLLMHLKEMEEPFGKQQIGSSAMAYKRNPMRSERVCSIARFVITLAENAAHTAANQWFERTLDDSANRRLVLPQAFLAVDGLLSVVANIVDGVVVYEKVIEKHIAMELPFTATENILMACVKAGGDRQELHEKIREMSMEAGRRVKEEGKGNELIEMIRANPAFESIHASLDSILHANNFIGRCPQQVDEFIADEIDPILNKHKDTIVEMDEKIRV